MVFLGGWSGHCGVSAVAVGQARRTPWPAAGFSRPCPTFRLGSSILHPWAWLANFAKNPGTRNDLAGNRTGRASKSHGGLTVPAYINAAPAYLLHAPPANAAKSAGRTRGIGSQATRGTTACHNTPRSRNILPRNPQNVPRNLRKVRHFPYPSPTKSPHPWQNAARAAALRAFPPVHPIPDSARISKNPPQTYRFYYIFPTFCLHFMIFIVPLQQISAT